MKTLTALALGWLLLFPLAAAAPAKPLARKFQGTIVTWSHATFALQPPRGKASTFLLARATRIYGRPVKGARAAIWYTVDKTGKRWARQVKILRAAPKRPALKKRPIR